MNAVKLEFLEEVRGKLRVLTIEVVDTIHAHMKEGESEGVKLQTPIAELDVNSYSDLKYWALGSGHTSAEKIMEERGEQGPDSGIYKSYDTTFYTI